MEVLLLAIASVVMVITFVFGWIAMAFASLPGSHLSYEWHARSIRGLFYTYPAVGLFALSQLLSQAYPLSLIWCLLPCLPVLLVYIIFKVHAFLLRKRRCS